MFDCSCCSKSFQTIWGLHAHERYHKKPGKCGSVTNDFDVDLYISWEEYNESSEEEVEGIFEDIAYHVSVSKVEELECLVASVKYFGMRY